MKRLLFFILLSAGSAFCQEPTPRSLGFQHTRIRYEKDTADVLIYSKRGDEEVKKPLLFFCQGSMPQPLIKYDKDGAYGVFPFSPDSLATNYHLVIVGKPGVPLAGSREELQPNFCYTDSTGCDPVAFQQNNHLDFYVKRNLAIIKRLQQYSWVSKKELVVAGHSEGSSVALGMAVASKKVTQLIYSGGNPAGRIVSMLSEAASSDEDDSRMQSYLQYWREIVDNPQLDTAALGDPFKTTWSFSQPLGEKFMRLKIPVYITYGSKDWCAPFILMLAADLVRTGKTHVEFHAYQGCEHNFFPMNADGSVNYEQFNWDKVAVDWEDWLLRQQVKVLLNNTPI